jgi:hypothetical protein
MNEPLEDEKKNSKKEKKNTFSDSQWKLITGFFGTILVNEY